MGGERLPSSEPLGTVEESHALGLCTQRAAARA
jgi:hypothetical protein